VNTMRSLRGGSCDCEQDDNLSVTLREVAGPTRADDATKPVILRAVAGPTPASPADRSRA